MAMSRDGEIPGLFIIIENGNLKGLARCCEELAKRGIPAVITLGEEAIDGDAGLVKDLAGQDFFLCGKLPRDFHGEQPYSYQLECMKRELDKFQEIAGRPLCGLTARHFVHNEATIRVADELKLGYVFVRGAGGIDARIYKPREWDTTVVAVSMVPAMDGGIGSLCEITLWSAGRDPEDFAETLFGLRAERVTTGIHSGFGAVKIRWWNVYRDFLDGRVVAWKRLEEFAHGAREVPVAQIPRNTVITYEVPRPKIPMDQEPECQPR